MSEVRTAKHHPVLLSITDAAVHLGVMERYVRPLVCSAVEYLRTLPTTGTWWTGDTGDPLARAESRRVARRPLCSYSHGMNVATVRSEVGIRELKNGLSSYIDRVRDGEEVIVTDRGRPVARLSSLDAPQDRLAELVASGVVRPPSSSKRYLPKRRAKAKGSVSELVARQRR